MGLLDYLGPIGAIVGGPAGGAIGGLVGGLLGGGQQATPQAASMQTGTDQLTELLKRQAWLQGFQQTLGLAAQGGQTYSEQAAMGEQNSRTKQQTGGRIGVPGGAVQRSPFAQGAGGGEGKGAGSSTTYTSTPATQNWTPEQNYFDYLQKALSGQDTLPQSAFQGAVARGSQAINQQTQAARQRLLQALASRGISNSGMLSQGLMGIEQGRTQALGTLYGGLEQQGIAAQRASQQAAATTYAAQREAALNRALQSGMQQTAIGAAQPSWADYLGGLAGTFAQYYYAPDYEAIMRQFTMGATPTTSDPFGILFGGGAPLAGRYTG